MKKILSALIFVFCAAQPVPAAADEWLVMSYYDFTSASDCIGKPVTPFCAVLTEIACDLGGYEPFCDAVEFGKELLRWVPDDYGRLIYNRYKFLRSKPLRDFDIPSEARRKGKRSWRAGDLVLQVRVQSCFPDDECVKKTQDDPALIYGEGCRTLDRCESSSDPLTYILRRRGDRWIVVDGDMYPPVPESYWKRK